MAQDLPNLWTAASDGDLERVKLLLESEGMSANAKDQNGYTAIHAAASWAHPSLLRYLLSKGGDINVTDNDGDTPLFTVETLDMCKLVLELGGDPHLHNQAGETAAQSLQEEHPDISRFLCTLTGESLPERTDSASMDVEQATSEEAQEAQAAAAAAFQNAAPPEEIMSLDPASREAAIETNNRAGNLLARVQAILEEADRTGEDPEPRIREIVNETVQSTMQAGRELATLQTSAAGTEQEEPVASQAQDAAEKRQRTDDEPGR